MNPEQQKVSVRFEAHTNQRTTTKKKKRNWLILTHLTQSTWTVALEDSIATILCCNIWSCTFGKTLQLILLFYKTYIHVSVYSSISLTVWNERSPSERMSSYYIDIQKSIFEISISSFSSKKKFVSLPLFSSAMHFWIYLGNSRFRSSSLLL